MSAIQATPSDELKTSKITLYGNHVGPTGAQAVADVMAERPEIRMVNLQTNAIGVEQLRRDGAHREVEISEVLVRLDQVGDGPWTRPGQAVDEAHALRCVDGRCRVEEHRTRPSGVT